MKPILAVVAVFGMASTASAFNPINVHANPVGTNIATFDPNIFEAGPFIDVYEIVAFNSNASDVTSLEMSFLGDFVNNNAPRDLTFKDSLGLPMLGPNTVAETFFNLPKGNAPLAVDIIDTNAQLSASWTVAGDTALVPAGREVVIATLSVPTGTRLDFSFFSHFISNSRGVIDGEFVDFCCVPEPSTALLISLVVVGAALRRRV